MAILKCKMCGGDLSIANKATIVECDFCGTTQTVPNDDSEKKTNLFNRANRLRIASEFEKAEAIYENIVAEFPDEAEAYWGLCLCKYGIEYVDDPLTAKKIPTCHRTSFESIFSDGNYKMALSYADSVAQSVYESEAKAIDELQKKVLEIVHKEKPYDIFICYKEKDEHGERTLDSVLAQDIYDRLTESGYRVFFARITLELMIGQEYEPYIFAALNSAKVMLVVGTNADYFNAVWVKNEWSRYMALMRNDRSKNLIPCFKDVDPYDMPVEFNKLQAQDMNKIGFFQDLLRGIGKLIAPVNTTPVNIAPTPSNTGYGMPDIADMVRKTLIHLENKKWKSVQDSCNRILDIDPENAWAYVCHLARVRRVTKLEDLAESPEILSDSKYYTDALKYADEELAAKLKDWCRQSEENYRRAEEVCTPLRERAKKIKNLLSGGKDHTVGVLTDGTVVACGSNEKGQCNVGTWRNIIAVACGGYHTVGLRSDGTVVACGDNECGQCDVKGWTDIIAISCDEFHTAGLKSDGTLMVCGGTENGRCDITDWSDVAEVACGYHHTVGMLKDGTFVSAGSNKYGQCKVSGWSDIASFFANNVQTVGLKKNGKVVACGDNEDGQTNVKEWTNIVDISGGTHHTVGLKANGTVVACGNDGEGRSSDTQGWTDIVAVVCACWHTMGIRADGTIAVCGDNEYGKCDIGNWKLFNSIDTIEEERTAETGKKNLTDAENNRIVSEMVEKHKKSSLLLSGGENHTVALLTSGSAFAFGSNANGQCDTSNFVNLKAISCGAQYTVGLRYNGTVIATGDNEHGQCDVGAWQNVKSVSAGYHHTAAVLEDGRVVSCGLNDYGQCDVNEWTDIESVACGWNHTVALKKDGTVIACGSNGSGQSEVNTWSDIHMICTSNVHTVGLRTDGTVVACGNSEDGQCDVNDWHDIVAISCGSHHTVGLRKDGTVITCGHNPDRRCNTSDWHNIIGIVCGSWSTMGIRADGTIISCGYGSDGQLNLNNLRLFNNIDTLSKELAYHEENRKLRAWLRPRAKKIFSGLPSAVLRHNGTVADISYDGEMSAVSSWRDMVSVSSDALGRYVVGLCRNGTVVSCGSRADGVCNTDYWTNIVAINCDDDTHTVGIRADGSVVACGTNANGECEVGGWSNIVSVACARGRTYGLRSNGTVVACGVEDDEIRGISSWRDIVHVDCTYLSSVGLRRDGNVCAVGNPEECSLLNRWNNIIQISCNGDCTVGLRSNGTVLSVTDMGGSRNLSNWRNIAAVAAGYDCILGLRYDGTVVVDGDGNYGAAQMTKLRDIIAISANDYCSCALRADGTIFVADDDGLCEHKIYSREDIQYLLSDNNKVVIPTTQAEIQQIHNAMMAKRNYRQSSGLCLHCGGEIKGLLTKKCVACGALKTY